MRAPRIDASRVFLALMALALLLPLVATFLNSIASDWSGTALPAGWTGRYYADILSDERFHAAVLRSVAVSAIALVLATLIMVPAVVAAHIYWPMLDRWMARLVILPYAVRVVSASMDNLRPDLEEAAVLLGCSRLGAFFRVVLPNIRGGVLAAFILGFVTSFNEVPVSLFLSGPGVRTLPIDMIGYMEITYDPSVAALAALLAALSIGIVFAAERFLGLSRYV